MRSWLLISDMHVEKHCPRYQRIAMKLVDLIKPHGIAQLGDFTDGYAASRFDKDPRNKSSILDEFTTFNSILDVWAKHLGSGEIRIISGNHDVRAWKLVAKQAREIHDLVPSMDSLLRIKERNKNSKIKWTLYPYDKWDACKISNTVLTHGLYYGPTMCQTALAKYKTSVVFGHSHKFSYLTDGDNFAVSLGHAAITEEVMHTPSRPDWQQAMGLLHEINGKCHFEPILVNDGVACFRGKILRG